MSIGQANYSHIPNNSYIVGSDAHGEKKSHGDSIIKKTPLLGAKITADKLTKDVFVYAPKGMKGSRNSNFYEFLSLGLVPNIVGSATLIGLFNAANGSFRNSDSAAAAIGGRKMAAGVVAYAGAKWAASKLMNLGVQAQTGVDLDMTYKKDVNELADFHGDKDVVATEYHKVFESADFPRWDLINKMGEEQGNRHLWYDKIAAKMGYKNLLTSPEQEIQEKTKEVVVKASAAKAISGGLWAATGVALASQEPFGHKIFFSPISDVKEIIKNNDAPIKDKFIDCAKAIGKDAKSTGRSLVVAIKDSAIDLYKGNNVGFGKASKYIGKGLIFGALASTVLGSINAASNFKAGKNDNAVGQKEGYEVH